MVRCLHGPLSHSRVPDILYYDIFLNLPKAHATLQTCNVIVLGRALRMLPELQPSISS